MSCLPNEIVIKPDGEHEWDGCCYEDIEMYENVTVIVSKCVNCGNITFGWKRQPNTVEHILD